MISKMIPFPKTSKEVKAFKNKCLAVIATQLYKEYADANIDDIEVHLDRHQHLELNEIFFVNTKGEVPTKGIYVKPEVMNDLRDEVAVKIEIPKETDEEGNIINPEAEPEYALIANPGFQIGKYGNDISIIPVPLFPKEKYEMKGNFPEGMVNGDFIDVDKRLTDFSEKFAAVMKNTIFPAINKVEDLVPAESKDQTMYISFDTKIEEDEAELQDGTFVPHILVCLDMIPNKSEEAIQINRTPMDRYSLPEEKLGAGAVHQLRLIEDAINLVNHTSLADVFTKCNFETVREYAVEQFKVLVSQTIVKMHKPLYTVSREGAADELKAEYDHVVEMIRSVTTAPQEQGIVAKYIDINSVTFWVQMEDGDRNACPAHESADIKAYLEKFEQGFGSLLLEELARTKDCVKEMVLITGRKEWEPTDKIGETSLVMMDADGNPISGDPKLTSSEQKAVAEELSADYSDYYPAQAPQFPQEVADDLARLRLDVGEMKVLDAGEEQVLEESVESEEDQEMVKRGVLTGLLNPLSAPPYPKF